MFGTYNFLHNNLNKNLTMKNSIVLIFTLILLFINSTFSQIIYEDKIDTFLTNCTVHVVNDVDTPIHEFYTIIVKGNKVKFIGNGTQSDGTKTKSFTLVLGDTLRRAEYVLGYEVVLDMKIVNTAGVKIDALKTKKLTLLYEGNRLTAVDICTKDEVTHNVYVLYWKMPLHMALKQ